MDEPSANFMNVDAQMCSASPDSQNNISFKQPMSTNLRERLRKMRRSFTSPCTVAKRLKIDCEETETLSQWDSSSSPPQDLQESTVSSITQPCASASETGPSQTPVQNSAPATFSYTNQQDLLREKRRLLKHVDEKEEVLRRMKLVKLYRSKNNLLELQSLIEKWRKSSQLMIFELQAALVTEHEKISLTQLVDSYGLDEKLLHYNRAEEDFDDS